MHMGVSGAVETKAHGPLAATRTVGKILEQIAGNLEIAGAADVDADTRAVAGDVVEQAVVEEVDVVASTARGGLRHASTIDAIDFETIKNNAAGIDAERHVEGWIHARRRLVQHRLVAASTAGIARCACVGTEDLRTRLVDHHVLGVVARAHQDGAARRHGVDRILDGDEVRCRASRQWRGMGTEQVVIDGCRGGCRSHLHDQLDDGVVELGAHRGIAGVEACQRRGPLCAERVDRRRQAAARGTGRDFRGIREGAANQGIGRVVAQVNANERGITRIDDRGCGTRFQHQPRQEAGRSSDAVATGDSGTFVAAPPVVGESAGTAARTIDQPAVIADDAVEAGCGGEVLTARALGVDAVVVVADGVGGDYDVVVVIPVIERGRTEPGAAGFSRRNCRTGAVHRVAQEGGCAHRAAIGSTTERAQTHRAIAHDIVAQGDVLEGHEGPDAVAVFAATVHGVAGNQVAAAAHIVVVVGVDTAAGIGHRVVGEGGARGEIGGNRVAGTANRVAVDDAAAGTDENADRRRIGIDVADRVVAELGLATASRRIQCAQEDVLHRGVVHMKTGVADAGAVVGHDAVACGDVGGNQRVDAVDAEIADFDIIGLHQHDHAGHDYTTVTHRTAAATGAAIRVVQRRHKNGCALPGTDEMQGLVDDQVHRIVACGDMHVVIRIRHHNGVGDGLARRGRIAAIVGRVGARGGDIAIRCEVDHREGFNCLTTHLNTAVRVGRRAGLDQNLAVALLQTGQIGKACVDVCRIGTRVKRVQCQHRIRGGLGVRAIAARPGNGVAGIGKCAIIGAT